MATLPVPVTARGKNLGALNFYPRTGPFDDDHPREAEQSASLLSNAQV